MPRRSFQNLPPERRRELILLASNEFAKHGYHGTSYNQLLQRLGLGKSSAYYYFEDKADLFLSVVAECYHSFFTAVAELPLPKSAPEFWGYVELLNRKGFEFSLQDPTASALLNIFARERAGLGVLSSHTFTKEVDESYTKILRLGQSMGAVRTDLPDSLLSALSTSISVTIDAWFFEQIADARRPDIIKLAALATSFQRDAFEPRQSAVTPKARGPKARVTASAPASPRRRRKKVS